MNGPVYFPRLRRHAKVLFIGVFLFLFVIGVVGIARGGILQGRKEKLDRDGVYYEITNDNGDHGNYIETYHIPDGKGGEVYCIVYSDQIGKSSCAGISCDWRNG